MIKNYLVLSLRSLRKDSLASFINIIGLMIGISGALLVAVFVLDEFKYDQHFKQKERMYRITTTQINQGAVFHSALTAASVAAELMEELPEVQSATRLMPADEAFLFSAETAFKENVIYTDAEFLNVFNLDMLIGSKKECLKHPSSVIISQSIALKLFGSAWEYEAILGRTLSVDNRIPLTITGVFKDLSDLTHFKSGLFASIPSEFKSWMSNESKVYTYVLIDGLSSANDFYSRLRLATSGLLQSDGSDMKQLNAQPLTDIHLFSSLDDDNATRGNIKNIYALISVAFSLILMTVTNFTNLYTAKCVTRLKEVGVRKAVGALGRQVRLQFFLETLLITIISAVFAWILIACILPAFNEVAGKHFTIQTLTSEGILLVIGLLVMTISFLASLYPSIVMAEIQAIKALKGVRLKTGSAIGLRKGLILLQLIISGSMIVLSIVAFKQVKLINNKALGFDKENTVILANPYMLGSTEKILRLKEELLTIDGIESISITGYTPSQNRWSNRQMTFPGRDQQSTHRQLANWLVVDEGFIKSLGLTLVAGRNFLTSHESDRGSIIINEKAVSDFNLAEHGMGPIGTELSFEDEGGLTHQHYTVVGIVKDFNFGSLHESVGPTVMRLGYHRFEMVVKLSAADSPEQILRQAGFVWRKHLPIIPFEYSFIKDRFDRLHKSDFVASKIFLAFCFVTIMMSALGLFSMVAYAIASRTKEIGIRKLLGATEVSIVFLLAKQFILLVIVSYALALPVASILANNWLSDFAYKAEISWEVHLTAGLILLLVTVATLGFQSVKASMTNPVENLRHE